MANKNNPKNNQQDPEEVIESAINKTEKFLYDNGKMLLTILTVVVLAVGGYLGYIYYYKANRAQKAAEMMFPAEQMFQQEIYDVALNGDLAHPGFLDVISQYGGTPQGNVARHYAGVCYLNMGDLQNALHYLSMYKETKGAPAAIINAQNYGLQGDIYVEMKDYQNAITYFKKAVDTSDNSFTAPMYLKKLALVYNQTGNNADAIDALEKIETRYPTSMEARDVNKYIAAFRQQ